MHATPTALWAAAATFDLVVVATSTPSHVPLATAAIARRQARGRREAARHDRRAGTRGWSTRGSSRGVLLVPFLNRRWDSDHLTLQRLLRDGSLGTVLRYESRFDRWRPDARDRGLARGAARAEGGGVLLDLGAHLVDQALRLHGPASRVYAEVASRRGGADDDVFIALRHTSGVISHLWANALAAAPGPRLRVLGSRAAYVVERLDGQEDALRAGRSPASPDLRG